MPAYVIALRLSILCCTCPDQKWAQIIASRDQICTQVKASFSPFVHPTQVNASWVTFTNVLLANEIQDRSVFLLWLACTWEETCESVWPPNVSTQVQLAVTCDYFQFRLARALLWIYHFISSSYLVNISMTGVYSGIEYTIYKAPFDLPWEAQ